MALHFFCALLFCVWFFILKSCLSLNIFFFEDILSSILSECQRWVLLFLLINNESNFTIIAILVIFSFCYTPFIVYTCPLFQPKENLVSNSVCKQSNLFDIKIKIRFYMYLAAYSVWLAIINTNVKNPLSQVFFGNIARHKLISSCESGIKLF